MTDAGVADWLPTGAAPLLDAWVEFVDRGATPFTVPGHKRLAGTISPALGRLLDGDVPLFGGVGTIKLAAGDVARAEAVGARLWGADWCRYSTGGSTHANQAMALALGQPGDTVLVSRTAHRSTLLGLVYAGLRPVWLPCDIDERFGLPAGLSLPALEAALDAHPEAVALLTVEPSFVGTISDLPAVIELAHARDVAVVIDQAWGAHLGFHPGYPRHAFQLGADAMITSAHKTLPSYSQASIVAARTERLDPDRLERAFEASFTTSPSGTILASIDAARAVLADPHGADLLERLTSIVEAARAQIVAHDAGLVSPGPADFAPGRFDPAKLVVLLAQSGLSGNEIEAALIETGMPVELADRDTVIPIVTMVDDETSIAALTKQILDVAGSLPRTPRSVDAFAVWTQDIPPAPLTPREAFFAAHDTVAADAAVGRVSAGTRRALPTGRPGTGAG